MRPLVEVGHQEYGSHTLTMLTQAPSPASHPSSDLPSPFREQPVITFPQGSTLHHINHSTQARNGQAQPMNDLEAASVSAAARRALRPQAPPQSTRPPRQPVLQGHRSAQKSSTAPQNSSRRDDIRPQQASRGAATRREEHRYHYAAPREIRGLPPTDPSIRDPDLPASGPASHNGLRKSRPYYNPNGQSDLNADALATPRRVPVPSSDVPKPFGSPPSSAPERTVQPEIVTSTTAQMPPRPPHSSRPASSQNYHQSTTGHTPQGRPNLPHPPTEQYRSHPHSQPQHTSGGHPRSFSGPSTYESRTPMHGNDQADGRHDEKFTLQEAIQKIQASARQQTKGDFVSGSCSASKSKCGIGCSLLLTDLSQ